MSKQHSAISSYFTPVKKPENPINRPKVTISNTLKSANSKAAAVSFSPKQYQKPKGPFDLSSPSSQSTEKLTNHLAQFKFNNSQQKPPPLLRDLNTPKNAVINLDSDDDIDRLLMEDEEEEEEEAVESNDSEDNSVAVTTTRRVLRKRKQRQPIMIQDSEDEDLIEEEEEEEQPQFKRIKKTRRTISDMTDEDDEMDDDDDGDDSYVDENQKLNQAYDAEEEETSVNRIKGILPKLPVERIREAIRKTGSAVKAIIYLNKQIEQEEKGISIDLDAEEEDEEMEQQTRDQLDAVERDILVLKMFNTASATEIQAMTGCKTNKAEIMVEELRPFEDMDDLEDKLKRTKGLSVKYIDVFQEMVDGYYKVDAMIREIEKKGTRLRSILNIWQGIKTPTGGQNTPVVGSDNEDDDKPDEKAGTHLMHLDVNPCIDQDSEEYKDAMDGYISQQPKYVNKEFTLKDYQILGVNWMLLLYRKGISGILADEMGLGKTAQVISFLGRLYEMGESGPHLVIVPSSTMENWMREFERFCPKLKVRLYHGSINERAEQRYELSEERDEFQVLVTTYNVATSNKDDRSFLRQLRCTSMVLDEGHMIKNCTSARYINLMKIKTPFRLLLTGTPLQNNLQELVSLLMFIMPDTFSAREEELRSIFKIRTSSTSTDQYQQDGKEKQGSETAVQILSRERIQRAKQMMTPFVLRRKKQDVLKDLPQKQQVIQKCIMTTNQKQLYSDIILKSKKSLEAQQEENKKERKSAMKQQFESMSNIIVHLRKAADHPLLFRKIYTDELLRTMAKEIMAEVKYWDANEEYIYEDMTVMSDFELNNLCKEHKVRRAYLLESIIHYKLTLYGMTT